MSQQPIAAARLSEGPVTDTLRPKRVFRDHLVYFIKRKPLGAAGALVAILLVFVATFAPVIANHDPYEIDAKVKFGEPTLREVFRRRSTRQGCL